MDQITDKTTNTEASVPAVPRHFAELPPRISLAETSTTYDTSTADSSSSLGSIAATSPLNVALGTQGADDGD